MASDKPGILHNGKQIKKKWTQQGAMVLPLLVPLALEGMRTAREQACDPDNLLSTISDYMVM